MGPRNRPELSPVPSVELHRQYVLKADLEPDVAEALLNVCPLFSLGPGELDTAFVLELSSVVVLRSWEEQDVRVHFDVDLPSYHEAANDFAKSAARGPTGLGGSNADRLFTRLLNVYLENFAYEGRRAFQAEVLLGEIDEDKFVDILANFLWSHRNELSEDRPADLPAIEMPGASNFVPDYEMLEKLRSNSEDDE